MASTLQLRNFAQKCKFPTSGKLEYLTMVNLLPTSNHWLSDWIFLDLAPVCHSSHHSLFSLHADLLSLCMHCCFFLCLVWSHEFASLTTAVLPRETLPRTLCAIFSVRPSLPSACVTPSPYFPLIFTFFYR